MKTIARTIIIFTMIMACASVLYADGMVQESAKDSFFKAVRRGDVTGAKGFLDTAQVSINDKDTDGNTALMIAVDRIDLPMVIALIPYKPTTTAKNNNGETVMNIAEKKGNAQLTATLKNAGF